MTQVFCAEKRYFFRVRDSSPISNFKANTINTNIKESAIECAGFANQMIDLDIERFNAFTINGTACHVGYTSLFLPQIEPALGNVENAIYILPNTRTSGNTSDKKHYCVSRTDSVKSGIFKSQRHWTKWWETSKQFLLQNGVGLVNL
jgi:hypothetical protein